MNALPFIEWLPAAADRPVVPLNLEHFQARCAHVHDAVVQILVDHEFKARTAADFPLIEDIADRTADEIAEWWLRFHAWYSALSLRETRKLNSAPVLL